MRFGVSAHFTQRCSEREISMDEVRLALEVGELSQANNGKFKARHSGLVVIFRDDELITAYRE